jgi:hypothetical protein
MSVTIKWNGRDPEDALNRAVFDQVAKDVARRLRTIRCPVHGSPPTAVAVTGHDLASLTWEVRGCCDRLRDAAADAFK